MSVRGRKEVPTRIKRDEGNGERRDHNHCCGKERREGERERDGFSEDEKR